MELHIKNMVCGRCIMVVKDELIKFGLTPLTVDLGVATLSEDGLTSEKLDLLSQKLKDLGFEVLDSSKSKLIEKIKIFVIDKIHHTPYLDLKINWSSLLADELHHDYNYLSSLFSSVEGITLEQYIIRQKIEKAKELLFYDEKTLSEIAYSLGYSSVAHLSAQFKKVTGQTPSQFKQSRENLNLRKPLDDVK
ncbi:AraC family transcriptional regulator [Pelobium sp.]|nr:AraC family transcriptional regulator [Pelobium sp.]MDA9555516.1 AraC family transcriptional regulator [Pelobium sp.]